MDLALRAKLDRESRSFTVQPVELRDASESAPKFAGFASTVDKPYEVHDMFGSFRETMKRGSFTKTLSEGDKVSLLVNHDGIPLASTRSGTLLLAEKPDLYVESTLDGQSPLVQTLRSAMVRGDMDQMSIGFQVLRQEWNVDYSERMVHEVRLFDVSVVTDPANPGTSASMRSASHGLTAPAILAALSEVRAGATLSTATMNTLKTVLGLVNDVDESLDAADKSIDDTLVTLSKLMGVPNPDVDAGDDSSARSAHTAVMRMQLDLMKRRVAA